MDKTYKIMFIISIAIHCIVLIIYIAGKNSLKLNLNYTKNETKIITMQLIKNKTDLRNITEQIKRFKKTTTLEKIFLNKTIKTNMTDFKIDYQVDAPEIKPHDAPSEIPVNTETKTFLKKQKKNLLAGETFNIMEDDITAQTDGIKFNDGEKRTLLNNKYEELKTLDFISSTELTVEIRINTSGDVTDKKIIKSSGEIKNDTKFLEIVGNWHFNSGDRVQTAIITVKYLLD